MHTHASAVIANAGSDAAPLQGATASGASRQVARTYSGSSSLAQAGSASARTPTKHHDADSATGSGAKLEAAYSSPAQSTTVR